MSGAERQALWKSSHPAWRDHQRGRQRESSVDRDVAELFPDLQVIDDSNLALVDDIIAVAPAHAAEMTANVRGQERRQDLGAGEEDDDA